MKRIKDFELFRENGALKQLSETTKNTASDRNMSDSGKIVVDFDQAKTNYCNSLGKSEEYSASADAFCETVEEGKYFLIEFKDGEFNSEEIRKKAADSAYILSGILCKDVNYVRKNIEFIIVYNGEIKRLNSRQKLSIARANRGRENFDIWGLEKICGFYFDNIKAYEKHVFEKEMLGRIRSIR